MKRYLYAFLAAVLVAATSYGDPPGAKASSVVKVMPGKGHGSGVHIGGGYIITAYHVIEGAKELKLKTSSGKEISGEVLWANKAYDIALLRADGAGIAASKLACRNIAVGDIIRSSGNPTIIEFVDSYGKVAGAKRALGPWKSIIVTDITTVPGMSGGPVFDEKGEVVGITVGVMTLPMGFSAALTGFGTMVPSSTVCELLGRGVV